MPWTIAPYDLFPQSKASDSKTGSAARGIAYHQRVYNILARDFVHMDELELHVEPWLFNQPEGKWCQPDAVVINHRLETAAVIEVKMNWKIGRDHKVLGLYKEASKQAFETNFVVPSMIVSNVWKMPGTPIVSRAEFYTKMFQPGPMPLLLIP